MKRLFLLLLLAIAPTLASAQAYAMRDSVSNGYDFWLYVPNNYSDNRAKRLAADNPSEVGKPLPVIVFLHGRSLSGKDINIVKRYGTIDALWRGRKINAVVIAPQVNHGDWWRPERVMNVVEWVGERYDVDLSRLYVMGMSLGGYGTLDFAATYPDRTAAAVALCGGSTKKASTLQKLNQVPLWIMHGTADASVPVSESRKVKDAMSQGDPSLPRLRYDEHVGANHSVYARVFYIEEIYNWLMKHSTNDKNRPVDRNLQIPHSRYSSSSAAYAGLPRGGNKIQFIDPPTKSNTKGRLISGGSEASKPTAQKSETTKSEEQKSNNSQSNKKEEKSSSSATSTTAGAQYHTIAEGDTLGHIAVKYDTTVAKFCELNDMEKTDILKLGRQLKVSDAPEVVYHTIESGDSYWAIAEKYNTTVAEIFTLNNLSETTILHPGDKIIVKSSANSSTKKSEKKSSTTPKSNTPSAQYHTIEDGDTLGHIAIKYDTTVKKICELNDMQDTDILKLGKKLRVK